MKKLFYSLFIIAALGFIACSNEKSGDKADTGSEQKVDDPAKAAESVAPAAFAVKAHACTDACTDGNHSYAHGDVGHTCTDACGSAHVCTDKCADGTNHMYAHGESGHTCTDACVTM